jgi:cupin 2 domain-containing protein
MTDHEISSASGNLFTPPPRPAHAEQFTDLLSLPGARVERIVSTGQCTPAGEWLDQDWTEWVVLLAGAAAIRLEGETQARVLRPGDWLTLPAGLRHRVDWTDAAGATIWLAVHIGERMR